MFANPFRLQVNLFIVFLGAAAVIALLKISSYFIPARYYFSFSELIGGGSEPFLVDPPAVTGRKLCDIIVANNISPDIFNNREINCSHEFAEAADPPPFRLRDHGETTLSARQIHQIYDISRSNDPKMRAAAIDALTDTQLDILLDDQVASMLREEPSARKAFDKIFKHYQDQFRADPAVLELLTKQLDPVFFVKKKPSESTQIDPPSQTNSPTNPNADVALSEDDIARLTRAHRLFFSLHNRMDWTHAVKPITRAKVDEIVRSGAPSTIPNQLAMSYTDSASTWLLNEMKDYFGRTGVRIPTANDERLTLYKHILSFSYGHYTIAVLFRIAPVFLFGLIIGLIAGRTEVLSVSIASALAGFLLSWPLMLMWDRLVHSRWSDKYEIFLTFYTLLIIAFFATGRAGALIGAWIQEHALTASQENRVLLTVGYVALNVGAAAALNIFAYVVNSAIPLVFGE